MKRSTRKVVAGSIIALLVGAAGHQGVSSLAQHVAARQVDALLERWQGGAGTATRGRISFSVWTRTLQVSDIAVERTPHARLKVGQIVVSGIGFLSRQANRIDITDLEMSEPLPGAAGLVQQKAPSVTLRDFSIDPLVLRGAMPALDVTRRWLEILSSVSASSVSLPSLTITVSQVQADPRPGASGRTEYAFSNITLQGVRKGRIALATADRVAFESRGVAPLDEVAGEIRNVSASDVDVSPVLAFLDAARPGTEGYRRVFREASAGPYTFRFGAGIDAGVDRVAMVDAGLRPGWQSLNAAVFLARLVTSPSAWASLGRPDLLADGMADVCDHVQLRKLEILGFRASTPQNAVKLARLQMSGLENGRLAELAIAGLDGPATPYDPVHVGHLALKGLDVANFLRTTLWQPRSAFDQLVGLFALLDGVELEDTVVPDPATSRPLHLQTLHASWGQLRGQIWGQLSGVGLSQARLAAKLTAPIPTSERQPLSAILGAQGMLSLTATADIGASWTEGSQTLALAPARVEIGDVVSVSLKASVVNVPRQVFSTSPMQAMGAAALAEAGPIEVSLHDLGGVELAVTQVGRVRRTGPELGRTVLMETLARTAQALAQTNPDVQPVAEALIRFVQGKGETLTIRLTPKGRVRVSQLLEAGSRDLVSTLLGSFSLEARTGG